MDQLPLAALSDSRTLFEVLGMNVLMMVVGASGALTAQRALTRRAAGRGRTAT